MDGNEPGGVGSVGQSGRRQRLRLLLVTQYYRPEVGAAQTRLAETVAGLKLRGFSVTVVAPPPSYPMGTMPAAYSRWRPIRERIEGADVIRLPAMIIPGATMARRLAGHATFAAASVASVALAAGHDVALVESPPLLLAVSARALRKAGLPYVFHVADPWPDFPIAMGYLRSPLERRLAYWLEAFGYRGAGAITTVSEGLVTLLSHKPGARGKVSLLPNGADLGRFDQGIDRSEARRQLGWDDGFTLVYAGTVGLAQGVGTLLEAAHAVDPAIRIRVVGDGVERALLEARARDLGLGNVLFEGAVPADRIPLVLAAADAGLVLLRSGPLYEASLPTKLVETMAAGRPVVVSANGLAAEVVTTAGAGYQAPAEDPAALARAIEACRDDPARSVRGEAAKVRARRDYDRDAILDRLAAILSRVADPSPAASRYAP
jgi:colanic acid biosynthesis glycosyl transferase WcaI